MFWLFPVSMASSTVDWDVEGVVSVAARTWEEQGLRRRDGSLAAKPWTQAERNAWWVEKYRAGLTFREIALASPWPARPDIVQDTVASFFARNGFQNWRRPRRAA